MRTFSVPAVSNEIVSLAGNDIFVLSSPTCTKSSEKLNVDIPVIKPVPVSYTHLTLPTNREV